MGENCDMQKINKTCTSVQANIMSLMNRDSLLLIDKSLKKEITKWHKMKEKIRENLCV